MNNVRTVNIQKMISSKELRVHEKLKEKYNSKTAPDMKYKRDGTLDMRYSENVRLFGKEYKNLLLMENRNYNNICDSFVDSYREDIINLTEKEIDDYYRKIETK